MRIRASFVGARGLLVQTDLFNRRCKLPCDSYQQVLVSLRELPFRMGADPGNSKGLVLRPEDYPPPRTQPFHLHKSLRDVRKLRKVLRRDQLGMRGFNAGQEFLGDLDFLEQLGGEAMSP